MVIAGLVGVVALVFALRPAPSEIPYNAQAPPIAYPASGIPTATSTTKAEPAFVRIQAPAGGIDLAIVEGDGVHVPMNLASHYPGTAQPGPRGNAVYYAHAQPGMFLGLYKLHRGDEVRTIRQDGTQLVFHVTAFRKVAFNDRSVLLPTPFGELTLLTCTTYDPYTPRFIVLATES
jgi:LPXTG-site transpeptidase (sortase) family protein